MKGDLIPDEDHVARKIRKLHTHDDDGSVDSSAFRLRECDKSGGISVNWIESVNREDQRVALAGIKQAFDDKGYTLRPNHKFAILNVGESCAYVKENSNDSRELQMIHRPTSDTSHSEIYGIRMENDDITSVLLARSVQEVVAIPGL